MDGIQEVVDLGVGDRREGQQHLAGPGVLNSIIRRSLRFHLTFYYYHNNVNVRGWSSRDFLPNGGFRGKLRGRRTSADRVTLASRFTTTTGLIPPNVVTTDIDMVRTSRSQLLHSPRASIQEFSTRTLQRTM